MTLDTSLQFSYHQLAEITIRAPWNNENIRKHAARGLQLLQQLAEVSTAKALLTCNVVVQGTTQGEDSFSIYYCSDFATLGNSKPITGDRFEGHDTNEIGQRSLLIHEPKDVSTPSDLAYIKEVYQEQELIDKLDKVLYQQSGVRVVEIVNIVIIFRALLD